MVIPPTVAPVTAAAGGGYAPVGGGEYAAAPAPEIPATPDQYVTPPETLALEQYGKTLAATGNFDNEFLAGIPYADQDAVRGYFDEVMRTGDYDNPWLSQMSDPMALEAMRIGRWMATGQDYTMDALSYYADALLQDGNWANYYLDQIPPHMREAAMRYFYNVFTTGNWENEWANAIPQDARDPVMRKGYEMTMQMWREGRL